MLSVLISVGTIIVSTLICIIGYLVKRSIFKEIDELKQEVKNLDIVKVSQAVYNSEMKNVNGHLEDIKRILGDNSKSLQKMEVDVAVVKSKVEKT